MEDYVLIPRERVAILIGAGGSTKRLIETRCKVGLDIGADGRVVLTGESLDLLMAKSIVKAIGRGFSPERAGALFDDENILEIIDLDDYFPNEKAIMRQKSRIIGKEGKTRKKLEKMLSISLSIYGNTISIIGKLENVEIAKRAIERLINGAMHSTMFKIVEKAHKEVNME